MTPEQCQRVDQLFVRALELPEDRRDAFLREEATDDPAVLDEVASLLRHTSPAFLGNPEHLIELAADGPLDEHPEAIDRYAIEEVLGEGGMGIVYRARQAEPVQRTVALKLIKLGMDTRKVVARFDDERQSLALMSHSAIARVFDAGATEQGRPYFVMEYVDGLPLTRFCDEQRLGVGGRLELFIQVCDGIQHAHQKGIIHRDIKPSNILVSMEEGKPLPKIIDFGIARATDRRNTEATAHTELGQIVGTPEYMSPEQADFGAEDVDTRTDVYSLGVLLYELLLGRTPFAAEDRGRSAFEEICRKIRETEPVKPSSCLTRLGDAADERSRRLATDRSSLVRRLRGDLDWVILRALEKDRARRYPSVSELAADIRRHLAHEPVQARPPATAYRVGKFIRRHRVGVAAAALVTIALVGGIVGTSLGMLRARRAEAAAREAQLTAQEEAARASREAKTSEEMLGAVDVSIRELAVDPRSRAEFLRALGRAYRERGLFREARPVLLASIEQFREAHGGEHPDVLESVNAMGTLSADLQEWDEAIRFFQQALPIAEQLFGEEDADYVAGILKNLGDAHENLGQLEAARTHLERALAIRVARFGAESAQAATTTTSIANVLIKAGDHDEGLRLHQEALRIRRLVAPDNDRYLGFGYFFLGQAQHQAGRLVEAQKSLEEAVGKWQTALGEQHANVAVGLFELARVHAALENREKALQLVRRARIIDDASFDAQDPDEAPSLVESLNDHAGLLDELGESAEAADLRDRAARIAQRVPPAP